MQSDPTRSADNAADTSFIDETARIRELQANVRNQDELERELGLQVCSSLIIFT